MMQATCQLNQGTCVDYARNTTFTYLCQQCRVLCPQVVCRV
jgi:hypothetical protein